MTATELIRFLDEHGHPDSVIVQPCDFIEIQLGFVPAEKRGANVVWFLGVEWIRAGNPGVQLDWSDKRIPCQYPTYL